MLSKSKLAIMLSKLEVFVENKENLEQYPTPGEIAADLLWQAAFLGDIDDKIIADLGCGTGILGIGALLLGAKKVFFVDKDKKALGICRRNIENIKQKFDIGESVIVEKNVEDFKKQGVDIVIQNPPFGTRIKHHDKIFLEKAFSLAKVIYSFHKTETEKFVSAISEDFSFILDKKWNYAFELKQTRSYHRRPIHRINVSCFRLIKN